MNVFKVIEQLRVATGNPVLEPTITVGSGVDLLGTGRSTWTVRFSWGTELGSTGECARVFALVHMEDSKVKILEYVNSHRLCWGERQVHHWTWNKSDMTPRDWEFARIILENL